MPIAILDPFSGISGDMTLGALVACGLDPEWLRALPGRLALDDVRVEIREVRRGEIVCTKVDFEIPPQPHGRGIAEIRALVAGAGVPDDVRVRADAAFLAIAAAEGEIHGMPAESVHLHEVGAVDAILDVVGAVWGFRELGVTRVHCGPIALGDGSVRAAHGVLPVPAPATLKILEGRVVRPGPERSGELVTPTGAALVRVLADGGAPPSAYVPLRSGFGAGTKDFPGRANALRLVLAEAVERGGVETVVLLAADVDDMTGEHLAAAAEELREAGALDVVLLQTVMKKGRPGTRLEVLASAGRADALERAMLERTTTIGVRRSVVERRALPRALHHIEVLGHRIGVKEVRLPDGGTRAKPEHEDVRRAALATGRTIGDISMLAAVEAERRSQGRVAGPGDAPAVLGS